MLCKRGLRRHAVSVRVSVTFVDCVTSSSAVAKRPRDASCLSVVSFNSTKRRVEFFIVSYVGCSADLSLRAVKYAVLLSLA